MSSASSSTSTVIGLPPTLASLLSGAAAPNPNPATMFSPSTLGTFSAGAMFSSQPSTANFFNTGAIVASSAGTQSSLAAPVLPAAAIEPKVGDTLLPAPFHFAHPLTVKLFPDNYLY